MVQYYFTTYLDAEVIVAPCLKLVVVLRIVFVTGPFKALMEKSCIRFIQIIGG